MQTLQLDEFLRSVKQNIDTPHSLLLGAGASIESGIPSAADCIWDWKREIYLSKNPGVIGNFDNSKSEGVRRVIQRWIDAQNIYPAENSADEYSYFAEKAYPIADDRRKYFQHLVASRDPSLGYHLISLLALENIIKSVWTTNFDGLTLKCAHQYSPLVPVEITADTSDRIYRGDVDKELLCIALHGDYKYGALKNTEKELDSQNGELAKALLHELTNRDLIVIGYSGRDRSLMDALQQVYSTKGAGKLFWCGYGTNVSPKVKTLIELVNKNGRAAFYVPTEGFDSTMYAIARHCMNENREFLGKVDDIKKKLSITLEPQHSGFLQPNATINKVLSTNAFPIAFPNQCYQFEVSLAPDENQWDFCKTLGRDDVMAVPYKNLVYAWGSKSIIEEVCKGKLKSNIELCPLSRATIAENGTFRDLLLKTLVHILAISHGLGHSKDKIWDTKEVLKCCIGAKIVTAYSGVRLALLFDNKKNPYLSEEEAYRIGLNIKELFYKSFSELPKRVVIHKRTPFRKEEVKGLVESLSSAGVKNIELLEITYEDSLKCFALNESCTQVDGYPVRRGMCFPIDKNTMYLFTHGIAPSVISPNRRYFQGGKSVPLPLKVVKHYGSGDMAQIATEILGLSKMNWNSFGLYSKLPCTIESSNEIARIGWLLSQFEGTLYDYRYFM